MFKHSIIATAISLSTSVVAQQADLERVVVYGTLTETPLSQTATSISILDNDAISERQAQHLETLFNRAANVNFSTGASRGRFVQIRGIGERSQFVDPINPSVGYLVDGIDYSGLLAGASTFDVAQVEIFKGPNSARFGAEGLAGMINVITEDATADFSGKAEAGIANYGSRHMALALNGEIVDKVNGRVALHSNVSDGFINNIHWDLDNTNDIDELTARAKFNWQATSDLNLGLALHKIDVDNGYDAFSLNQNRQTLSDAPGFDTQNSKAVALTADYQGFSETNLTVKVTTLGADLGYGYDEDWSFVGIAPGWEYSSTDSYLRDHDDKSLEVQLKSKDNSWVVGVYMANEEEQLMRDFFDWDAYVDAQFNSLTDTADSAIFGQYKYDIADDSWITVSGRLALQNFDYRDSNGSVETIDDNNWGGELSYHNMLDDSTMLYASLQRSYKMGGVNGEALSKANQFPQAAATFAPETMVGVEAGVKGTNADSSVRYAVTGFYQARQDVQYKNWINENQFFVGFVNNAADGTNYGLELEAEADINDATELFLNLGLLSTSMDGITREVDDVAEDISGRDQAHAPNYQANLGARYQFTDRLSMTVEVDAKDSFYYSFSHDQRSDSMALLHASIQYIVADWTVVVYGRNLTDQDYGTRGFFFGNDPRDPVYYAEALYEQLGEPRRVGVTVSTQF